MSENAKTIAFVAIGLLAISIGMYSRPSSAVVDEQSLVGQDLTKSFDSADEAKRLWIVRFDEDTATLREFEVAEQDGLWTIPSKSGYPADAARQMAEAATSLMDRKILQVASSNAGDHEEFGVIDPRSPKLEVGQKGVGTRVTMSDIHDAPLADLIIGKPVKDAEGQRFVREAGRDIVYVIEIDPAKLSTNFEDWIEKDLLKLNAWDLQQVQIKDYSAELVQGMTADGKFGIGINRDDRAEMTLAYNDTDSKWNASKLQRFEPQTGGQGSYVDFTLAEDEELNSESLNALKTALDELQIVDVVRKPSGLSDDLKAGADFLNNREAVLELMMKGFTAATGPASGGEEIISSDGEVIATMKNGTEYVLRFGNLMNVGAGDTAGAQDPAAGMNAAAKPSKDGDVHRYLFLMARYNESAVPRPELQELPELPAKTAEPAGEAAARETSSATPADAAPAATEPTSGDETGTETPAASEESKTGETADESEADTGKADATDEPNAAADTVTTEEATPPADGDAKAGSEKEGDLEKVIAERKRIETENQRKLDEYQQTLDKGRESVKNLNLRFGDWYFVVADDVFKKIRLGRESVVKKKEAKAEAGVENPGQLPATTLPGAIPGLPQIPGAGE